MASQIARRRWLAGAGAALALGAALLTVGVAGAQPAPTTPAGTAPDVALACKTAPPANAPAPGSFTAAVAATPGVAINREEIAARLAQALGKTREEVERAMAQVEAEQPTPQEITVIAIPNPDDSATLAPAAERLGVSANELAEAIRADMPSCDAGGSNQPTAMAVRIEDSAIDGIFDAIADGLGRGITAEQVKAAFEAARPQGEAGVQVRSFAIGNLEALARALGVTVEQLKTALESILPKPPVQRP